MVREYLSISEVAEMLGVSHRTIRRRLNSIPGLVKIGSVYRFRATAIRQVLDSGTIELLGKDGENAR